MYSFREREGIICARVWHHSFEGWVNCRGKWCLRFIFQTAMPLIKNEHSPFSTTTNAPTDTILHGYTRSITIEFFVIEVWNCASNLLKYGVQVNIWIIAVKTLNICKDEWRTPNSKHHKSHLNNGGSTTLQIRERKAKAINHITPAPMKLRFRSLNI
jgi:hypothetical protein